MRRLVLWLLGLGAGLSACTDFPLGDAHLVQTEVIAVPVGTFSGDTVEFRARATNASGKRLEVLTTPCEHLVIEISGEGLPPFTVPKGCNDIGDLFVLEAGEVVEQSIVFDGIGWRADVEPFKYRLPPGPYSVRVGVSRLMYSPSGDVPFIVH